MRRLLALVAIAVTPALAQNVISAKPGVIQHIEGQAVMGEKPVQLKFGSFPIVGEGQILATRDGRAEVLLAPGVFLRLDRHSSFRMLASSLIDSQVEVTEGRLMIEVEELAKGNSITVKTGELRTNLLRKGIYQFEAEPARVAIFDGKAQVLRGTEKVDISAKKQVQEAPTLAAAGFKRDKNSELYQWSLQRAALVAQANVTLARSVGTRGYRGSTGTWAYSPTWGIFTFLPGSGIYRSPFGLSFYSPAAVWIVYSPPVYNTGFPSANSGPSWGGLSASPGNASSGISIGGDGGGGRSAPAVSAPVAAPSGGRSR